MKRSGVVVLSFLVLAAVSGCSGERQRAAEVRGSCPDPIAGFEQLVDEQANESTLLERYSIRRLGPDRRTRSESRFACETVIVDAEHGQLVSQVVAEFYIDEADALLGFRYSETSEFDDAVGSVDVGFPRVLEGTFLGTRHLDRCIVLRALWSSEVAVDQAPTPEDRDALVREAFPDLAGLCQT
jgi:hypothetical protein